jgi:hypothetical protein
VSLGPPIKVTVDLRGFENWARKAIEKQVPFATAKALTKLAVLSRDEVRDDLPEHFRIRSGWVARGIQAVPANKRDWPNPFAVVGVRDQFMELQETGGEKRAERSTGGPGRVAVPARAVVRTSSGRIPKRLKPRTILDTKYAFKKEDGVDGEILLKAPRLAGQVQPLKLLYFLKPQTHLHARFMFRRTVATTFRSIWAEYFTEALQQALAVPKP